MASNKEDFKMIIIENKLISPRQLDNNFHSKRHNKSHLPQVGNSLRPVPILQVESCSESCED